jgi:hypothetical protein
MESPDYRQWWKHQGGQELRHLLMKQWKPIGFPVPEDEYDAYHGGVLGLLREGASPQRMAEHLAEVQQTQMGLEISSGSVPPVSAPRRD